MRSLCPRPSPLLLLLLLALSAVLLAPAHGLYCKKDNCYELLEIKRNATKSEVRRAFRKLSSEVHPDKNPNDEKALEKFRKLNSAYEALIDDEKRTKYNDFLDNPAKYWDYLVENEQFVYAPKSNTVFVIIFLLAVSTLLHWLNMNYSYHSTIQKMKESQEYKREVARLLKTNKSIKTKEQAESMINLDIVGLNKPDWRNLFIFKLAGLPKIVYTAAASNLKWFINYKIRKLEYSDEDKLYLIMKNLMLNDDDMAKLTQKKKDEYIQKELWDKEKCDEFLRLKRIEDNRLGKTKKKKKHTPIPYSEAEDVQVE